MRIERTNLPSKSIASAKFGGMRRRPDFGIPLKWVACIIVAPLVSGCISASDALPVSHATLTTVVANEIDGELSAHKPSGAFLFAIDNQIVFKRGYGVMDESNAPIPDDVLFPVGSLTKQFTAAAILQLAQRGKLRLDAPLSEFFPNVPSDKRDITVHQLLSHTSGLSRNAGDVYALIAPEDLRRSVFAAPLESAPGTKHAYSNSGYKLLGQIVEQPPWRAA